MPPPTILHTADWHLGRRLNKVERLEEQAAVLDDLVRQADALDADVCVVAGDIFDFVNPTAPAEALYYRALRALADGGRRAVLVVAGNHDSGVRLAAPRGVLGDIGVIVAGNPHAPDEVPEPRAYPGFSVEDAGPGWVRLGFPDKDDALFHLVPFPARSRLPGHLQADDQTIAEVMARLRDELPAHEGPRFLVAHLYVTAREEAIEEDHDDFVGGAYALEADAIEGYDAAFLGHIHRAYGGERWRYAGAPVRFDFDDPAGARGGWCWCEGVWSRVELEGGRDIHVLSPDTVDEALALAKGHRDGWVRLVFPPGVVVTPGQRRALAEAYGASLVDLQFAVEGGAAGTAPVVGLGRIDPEAAFRAHYEEVFEVRPSDEIVTTFLGLLQEEDDATAAP